jgi:hypothetical protein
MKYKFISLVTPDGITKVFRSDGKKLIIRFQKGFFDTNDTEVANALVSDKRHAKYFVIVDGVIEDTEKTLGTTGEESKCTGETNVSDNGDNNNENVIMFRTVNEAKDYLMSKGGTPSKLVTRGSCIEWARLNGIKIAFSL